MYDNERIGIAIEILKRFDAYVHGVEEFSEIQEEGKEFRKITDTDRLSMVQNKWNEIYNRLYDIGIDLD